MDLSGAGRDTILYVDDEEMARKYFARAFESEFSVLTAAGVDAALVMLDDPGCAVDVLVTDYRMPGRNGGELLRLAGQRHPDIARILVTAYADKDVLLDAINGGAIFRILEKPLDMEQVRHALRLACVGARERRARPGALIEIEETLAFLAHELTTPLATIVNFSRGIQRRVGACAAPTPLRGEIGDAAARMNDNAQYCLSVLTTFVDSARRGRPAAAADGHDHDHHSAAGLIGALLDAYPLTAAQRAAITIDIRENFAVTVLPNCVALVLSSLLSNALRALRGRPAPALCFTVLVDGHPQIRVADNGPGIDPALRERLLTDAVTTHADAGGNGLGMLFCKNVMQSFGGDIGLQSEPGRSTTVTLNFPVNKTGGRSPQH